MAFSWIWAVHALDTLDFLCGPLANVAGRAGNLDLATPVDVEDTVALVFTVNGGALGTAQWSFANHRRSDSLEIRGTRGTLSFSAIDHSPAALTTDIGTELFAFPAPDPIMRPFIQSVTDELEGRGRRPSNAESGARTSRVMDQALEGYYGTREGAFWSAPRTWPGWRPR